MLEEEAAPPGLGASASGSSGGPAKPSSSETYYRTNLDALVKENKLLKTKVEILERENRDLKRSVYQLSLLPPSGDKYAHAPHRSSSFEFDFLSSAPGPLPLPGVAGPMSPRGTSSETLHDMPAGLLAQMQMQMSIDMGSGSRIPGQSHHHGTGAFASKVELKAHQGAVYAVQFAPTGRLLASAGFDRHVRVWDVAKQAEVLAFSAHQMSIADLTWSPDSSLLLTGGHDSRCRLWDAAKGRAAGQWELQTGSFVTSVAFSQHDPHLFFAAATDKCASVWDRRQPAPVRRLAHDAHVNAVCALQDDSQPLVTADAAGEVRLWDWRKGAALYRWRMPDGAGVAHLSCPLDPNVPLLAVNCYDNMLRVYDLSQPTTASADSHSAAAPSASSATSGSSSSSASVAPFRLRHALAGAKTKNWPIRSSFFCGKEFHKDRTGSHHEDDSRGPTSGLFSDRVLVASGSADGCALVWQLMGPEGRDPLLQRIVVGSPLPSGGAGGALSSAERVYAVAFHPTEPLLATGSADFRVRVFVAKQSKTPTAIGLPDT